MALAGYRLKVFLYRGGVLVGWVGFHTLIPMDSSAHTAEPPGILREDEIEKIRLRLAHLPQINEGKVRDFVWREMRD